MHFLPRIIDKAEQTLSKSKLIVKFCVLCRNRLVRIIAYSLARDHKVENSGELVLIKKIGHLLRSVIDIGANKGEWSEMVLAESSNNLTKLLLAEPGRTAFSIIKNKFEFDKRFTLLNVGVSDSDCMLAFDEQENASETSSFSPNSVTGSPQIYMQVKKLDTIIKETNFGIVDFLKIDCEGFDLKVMNGALEQIKSQRVGIVQFEYNTMWMKAGSTLKAAFDLLLSCNYEVYLLNHNGLTPFNVDYYQEFFGYSNFVGVSHNWKEYVRDIIN